jgi:murein DD-endopeptidase MepM/ murein hydrolase activator NlpD
MTVLRFPVFGVTAMLLLSACNSGNLDWDLRAGDGALNTSGAVQGNGPRPSADNRGVVSYPDYQVAVARSGDTVASVAARVGIAPDELARYNALRPTDALREGEQLALPGRGAGQGGALTGGVIGNTSPGGALDVSTIATTALDRVGPATTPAAAKPAGGNTTRYQVKRGETAFSIARVFGVSARSLADLNGLGPDLEVREGQYLTIPSGASSSSPTATVIDETPPGSGSPTPEPPSAKKPLPAEKPAKAATSAGKPKAEAPAADLGADRTAASATTFAMPVNGNIIRGYTKKKNDGIDIAAAAGTAVKAASDGSVAAVTKDTAGTPIVVIRHADGILTVYAGVDGLKVAKGDKVKRGQTIAVVRAASPAFVHFEVRKGVDSVDPMPYLQ